MILWLPFQQISIYTDFRIEQIFVIEGGDG